MFVDISEKFGFGFALKREIIQGIEYDCTTYAHLANAAE